MPQKRKTRPTVAAVEREVGEMWCGIPSYVFIYSTMPTPKMQGGEKLCQII